ncbi:MAG: DNA mismatch repair endonuclease MutL [Clostridia bacterium]|nr:DNA mismatch repair endonuclease MutL [Clostridia bacterium]
MGKINVLPFEVANLIAAGEVVDRPASAIKELMENAIDAGATRMTVETQNGGVSYMRVTDNGCGISEEDLPVAVLRHATSKIRNANDLDSILTLGFRGEALAAIAAVSRLRIMSCPKDSDTGHLLEVDNGEIRPVIEFGCDKGTTVIAEKLFAKVPARRKFLKRDLTETMAVVATVEKIALSHPEIALALICDGQTKVQTEGDGSLLHVIRAIYGKEFASKLIEIQGSEDGISLHGFIGTPENVKANRNSQNFFINNRYIRSKTMSAALEQAFTSYCPTERFPVCFLFLDMTPERVDVNVHPSKLEVKFSDEKPVFECVYHSVRPALESNTARPEFRTGDRKEINWTQALGAAKTERGSALTDKQIGIRLNQNGEGGFATMTAEEYRQSVGLPPRQGRTEQVHAPFAHREIHQTRSETHPQNETKEVPAPAAQEKAPAYVVPEYRIAGQLFNTYIIVEVGDRALLVDKHAAHERINFERMKANMEKQEKEIQLLAVPLEVMMTSGEIADLMSYQEELEAIGFSVRAARNTVFVDSMPAGLDTARVPDVLQIMAAQIHEGTGTPGLTKKIIFEKALYQGACKASIKGGRVYAEEDEAWVIEQLMKIPDILYCPHGRPVAMEIGKSKLDRQFERT